MIQNKKKQTRIGFLFTLSLFLIFLSSAITPNFTQVSSDESNVDYGQEQIEAPETSDISDYEISGEGSTMGLYGFTNGTRQGDFDTYDTWSYSDNYFSSPSYTINTPDYVAEQPWEVDNNRVEVKNLKDRTNYIPNSDFSSSNDWDESDILTGGYGSVDVQEANNRGAIQFSRATTSDPTYNFDNWDAVSNNPMTTNRQQTPSSTESGDRQGASATVGSNYFRFTSYFDSYVNDEEHHSPSGSDGASCTASASASIGDTSSTTFVQTQDYFSVGVVDTPVATMSYDIDFIQSYCDDSSETVTYTNKQGGDSSGQYDTTCRIRMFIKHTESAVWTEAHDTGTLTFNEGTSNYDNYDESVSADVSSAITEDGQYQIRIEVYITFTNDFSGSAYESDSCGGHCRANCDALVRCDINNRLQVDVEDIDIEIDGLAELPDEALVIKPTPDMDFGSRLVEASSPQKLTFTVLTDSGFSGSYGDSRIFARFTMFEGASPIDSYTNMWGRIDNYKGYATALTWDIAADTEYDYNDLSGADSVSIELGVMTSNLVIDWDSGTDNVYFSNARLVLEGKPNVRDIDLELEGVITSDIQNGASMGDGSVTLPYYPDLTEAPIQYSFRSTSEKLTLDFYHTYELSYNVWGHVYTDLTTQYYSDGGSTIQHKLNFSVTTPYGSPTNFQSGKAYQDNFYFTLIFPKYDYLGDTDWDLVSASVDGKTKTITGQSNIGEVDENSNIYTPGISPSSGYGDSVDTTQYGIVYNDLMDEWISGSSQVLSWNILFTAANVLDDLKMSKNAGFSPETDSFITNEDDAYIKGILGETPDKGNGSVRIVYPSFSLVGKKDIANGSISDTEFYDFIALNDLPAINGYISDARFTQYDIANTQSGKVCRGIYKLGFQKSDVNIYRPTSIEGPIQTHTVYDTTTDSGLIRIQANYIDGTDSSYITDGSAYITIDTLELVGAAYKKNPILYNLNGWAEDTPMINQGNGSYVIYIDPSRNSDGTLAGNMSLGFHNYTITLDKEGFLPQIIKSNFTIEVDTYLRHYGVLYQDPVDHQNADLGWPHFVEGRAAGDPIEFLSQYVMNDSSSGSLISNRTGRYVGAVAFEYELVNTTDGLVNFSAVQDLIGEGFNPLNGSFTETANDGTFQMEIKWPTFDIIDTVEYPRYVPGIILEYNVTAYVRVNNTMNYDGDGYINPQFQPNYVQSAGCENQSSAGFDGWGNHYKKVEETIRFELVEYESVNKTQITLLNDVVDNNDAFAMGTFDNETHDYFVRNYYQNNTHDWFRIRAKYECTKILRDLNSDEAPPIGPLNKTNIFYGKEEEWAGNTTIIASTTGGYSYELHPDENYLWTKEVNTTGVLTPINASGVTYVSDKIYYKDFAAGTYVFTVEGTKDGFQESTVSLTLDVMAQETELYNETGDAIDTSLNPIQITTPRWNTTSFIIQYNDTTNPGEYETISTVDSVSIVEDETIDDRYLNTTGNDNYWGWETLGNGNYRISIYHTDMDPQTITLRFNVKKQNYTTGVFALKLTVRRRNATLHLFWTERGGNTVYCDNNYISDPLTDDVTNLVLSYEVWDEDNRTGGDPQRVDLRTIPGLDTGHILASFSVGVFSESVAIFEDGTTGDVRYNITIAADQDLGWHTITTQLDSSRIDDYYAMPISNNDGNIYIDKVSTNITILTTQPVEKPFLHYDQTRELTKLPRFNFQYWDENHSIQLDPAGLILDGTWNNNWNDGSDSLNDGGTNEDMVLQTSGLTGSIYFDIQMNDSSAIPYNVDINLNKTNYYTVYETLSFIINNQSTSFQNDRAYYGQVYYGETRTLEVSDLYIAYQENDLLEFYWGDYIGFRFTYLSTQGVYISNDSANDMAISYSFTDIDPILITKLMDEENGVYRFDLELENVTTQGTIDLEFNITLSAKNFDAITFGFNISVSERPTRVEILKSPDSDLKWTQMAVFQIEFLDQEFFNRFGRYGNYYIETAFINGSSHQDNIDVTIDGYETNWEIEELTQGRYNILINTTNLKVKSGGYDFTFNFSKTHYQESLKTINLDFNPLSFEIAVSVDPSAAFVPSETKEVTILVSLFITTYYWVNGRDVDLEQEINVDYMLDNISMSFELYEEDDLVLEGELEWDAARQAFVATVSTSIDGEGMAGIYDLSIAVSSKDPNFASSSTELNLVGLGTVEGELPIWFLPLLLTVVGAAIAMAGYAIKKAIYLRIPFVLRKIDETIKKIEKDKYPAVGVMTGREEFIINSVIDVLEEAGIEWERDDKFEVKKVGEVEAKEKLVPLSVEEIEQELQEIPGLSKEEMTLFLEELKSLDREAQDEFLASLKGDLGK